MKGPVNCTDSELCIYLQALGGGILADILLGHVPVCAVEIDHYCQQVLDQRQADGCLPWFPMFDDVREFDGRPWQGLVDVVAGGFPCQDISAAGKGAGIDGERSGLWREMARIIGEVRPAYAFVENSPMLTGRGLGRVCGDLAEMGYDATWGVVSAADAIWLAGDPCLYHDRERMWIFAATWHANGWHERAIKHVQAKISYATGIRKKQRCEDSCAPSQRRRKRRAESAGQQGGLDAFDCGDAAPDTDIARLEKRQGEPGDDGSQQQTAERTGWWEFEPGVGRVVNGLANRVDRITALGNGQVPAVAALAWLILTGDEIE